jgi:hypothetical protein
MQGNLLSSLFTSEGMASFPDPLVYRRDAELTQEPTQSPSPSETPSSSIPKSLPAPCHSQSECLGLHLTVVRQMSAARQLLCSGALLVLSDDPPPSLPPESFIYLASLSSV